MGNFFWFRLGVLFGVSVIMMRLSGDTPEWIISIVFVGFVFFMIRSLMKE